ncbi:Histone-lysine N-methyltransferase 2B isoform X1 [Oopsacas minuta]|uniref:Histone-lysine N-methyltransferase 2B isoform X1 n=1 Tax=Oopsacas minuta TaxID=111878 RepID=A0AAV7KIS5_9METZ|nr:Histone-lysine N-methyltransferase 2B isoform X1 [Oopsacas minuta]
MYNASATGTDETRLSRKKVTNYKSTMNSLSRKYPLVIISPNKELLNSSNNREFSSKSDLQQMSINKSKKSPNVFRLTQEANLNWELLKKKKLNKTYSVSSTQQIGMPIYNSTQIVEQESDSVCSPHRLNSPNRAKLRMSPAIDLPIRNQQHEEAIIPSNKSKHKSALRTSSRSNRGLTTKYSNHLNINDKDKNDDQSIGSNSLPNEKYPISKAQLVSRLISSTNKLEHSKSILHRRAKLHLTTPNSKLKDHLTHHVNSKFSSSLKVKSPTKLDNSYSPPNFSLNTSHQSGTNDQIPEQERLEISLKRNYSNNSLAALDTDNCSEKSSDDETSTQIETGMVGVYLEASYPQLPPLCSLCCSAGPHELIYCSICCDCYHHFCVGLESDSSGADTWMCSSCTSCAVCRRGRDVDIIHQCYKCQTYYHMGCLGIHLPFPLAEEGSNNWPCPRCVICQGCGTQRPEKFPEQLTGEKVFCKRCIFLRKKGNFCPVCDKVYEDNNWNCRMIQCDDCKAWLHDTCESLSDEDYHLLGELPGNFPYTCSICHKMSADSSEVAPWRRAVDEDRNKRIHSIVYQLKSQQMLGNLLINLESAPNGMKSFHSTLITVISNVDNCTYFTVTAFCKDFMSVMHEIFKLVDKHSLIHRYTFSLQTMFIKLICQEFPWFVIPLIGSSVPHSRSTKQEKKRKLSTRNCDYFPSSDFFNPTDSSVLFPAYKFDHKYAKSNSESNSPKKRKILSHKSFSSPLKQNPIDRRQCILCKEIGDALGEKEGRLLPCGINEWVHINCAIWSSDVYTRGSCIKNIDTALLTGLKSCCSLCGLLGATVGCYNKYCLQMVHYKCAFNEHWVFLKNMKVYCPEHGSSFNSEFVCSETDFLIDEFLFVESTSSQKKRLQNMTQLTGPRKLNIVSGCVRVYSLGSIVPSSDTRDAIYPVNFRSSRLFWSIRKPNILSTYTCFVKEYIPDEPITHQDINYTIPHDPDSKNTHISLTNAKLQNSLKEKHSQTSTVSLSLISPHSSKELLEFDKVKLDSPPPVEISSDINLGSDMCSSQSHVFTGLFEQSFPFFKQTDSSDITFQKVINYSKICANKLFPLTNEDFYLTQHLTRLSDSHFCYHDNAPNQQQQQPQSKQIHISRLRFLIVCSDGFTTQGDSLQGAWDNVIHELTLAREINHLPPLSFQSTFPQDMFGFTLHSVSRELEKLDDVEKCSMYQFKFHQPSISQDWSDSDHVYGNKFGAARCISYTTRSQLGMFNFFYSKHRLPPPQPNKHKLASILNEDELYPELQFHNPQFFENGTLPFFRYRQMIKNLPNTVRVFPSKIQGLGIYALRDIDPGDMIIEYTGLVIRPFMCDIKEALYESKGIGCYMFKIDQNQVVDGTMSGNASRFINHSCQPNCASKIVIIELKKKILIFAQRKILMGEELTYDYKFPLEDIKIPCLCKSRKCRKYMN